VEDIRHVTEAACDDSAADVIIVGAGPVGLMLAAELCLGGVRAVVLERLPGISDIPKGNGLVGQIVTVLDYRGLLDRLRAESTYTGPVPSFSFGPLRLDFSFPAESPLQVLAVPQRRLEHVLAERLAELGGTIRRGHEMTSFDQDDDAVTVTVTGPDGRYQLRAAYMVGCDGAHSAVRKLAGIGFPGYTSPEVSLIGRVTLPDAVAVAKSNEIELPGLGRIMLTQQQRTPRGMYSIAPLTSLDATAAQGTYIVFTREDADPGTGAPAAPARRGDDEPPVTLAELQASFRRVTGADVAMTDPTWLTRTAGNTRQADRYLDGRVLLAGDAAHVFGLALNAGLLDAVNLGWKLAAQVRGRAPAGLLASYHAERQAAGRRALLHTRAQRALTGSGESADAIRELFGELLTLPGVASYLGELIAGTDVRYDMPGSTVPDPVGERNSLTGRLAPDLRLTTQDGRRTRVAELMRPARPLLLHLAPDGRVAATTASDGERVPTLVARPEGGTAAADALLIRPDGIVAWASGPGAGDPAAGLAGALDAWLR
jgi:2-polyprenyl-6-methoxyphenol hydroxylase-like FAD-dependent oxidoreductase